MSAIESLTNRSAGPPARGEAVREFDVRFFLRSLVVFALFAALVTGLYFWQQVRLVGVMLQQAEIQVEREDWSAASQTIDNLLLLRPNHPRGVVLKALAVDRTTTLYGNLSEAIRWYYRAVGFEPDDVAMRIRLAELLVAARQYSAALAETSRGLQLAPADPQLHRWDILAQLGLFRTQRSGTSTEIRTLLSDYSSQHPDDVLIAMSLAQFLRRDLGATTGTELAATADGVVDRLVEASPNNFRAVFSRYRYRTQYSLEGSEGDLIRALQLAPKNIEVLTVAARDQLRRRQWLSARALFRSLILAAPRLTVGYVGLGDVDFQLRRTESAVETWRDGLDQTSQRDLELNIRLAEGLIEIRDFAAANDRLELVAGLIQEISVAGDTQQRRWTQTSLDLLRGKWHLRQGDYRQGVPLLKRALRMTERLRGTEQHSAALEVNALLLLAEAYELHDHRTLAAETYAEAFRQQRDDPELGLRLAESWSRAGQDDKARAVTLELLARPNPPPAAILLLAQLELNTQLQRVPIERDWARVDRALDEAEQTLPESWRVQLLKAKRNLLRGGVDHLGLILQQLLVLEREHAEDAEFWHRLIFTYEQLGQSAAADRALNELERLASDPLEPRLARAELCRQRGELDAARQILDAAERWAGDHQLTLHRIDQLRWSLASNDANPQQLNQLLHRLADRYPTDIRPLVALAELALSEGDLEQVRHWEERIGALEDEDQAYARYFQARQLLADLGPDPQGPLKECRRLLDRLSRARPGWAHLSDLEGLWLEASGRPDEAVESFKRSIRQGNERFAAYSDLIRLLYQLDRFAEAEIYFDQLQGVARPQQELTQHAVALRSPNLTATSPAQATALAPQDAVGLVWRGQALAIAGQDAQAAGLLQRAVELDSTLPIAWIALASFTARHNGHAAAHEVLERLSESNMQGPQKAFALGYGHELLGERQRAVEYYRRAQELKPDQPELLVRLASCLLAFDRQQARDVLQQALQFDPHHPSARRLLATLLSDDAGGPLTAEVRQLVPLDTSNLSNWRFQAVLLAQRNRWREAAELLEQVIERSTAQPGDWLLLGQLREQMGQRTLAFDTYLNLSRNPGAGIRELSFCLDYFLQQGDADEARRSWDRLNPLLTAPWPRTALQARLQQLEGNGAAARATLTSYVDQILPEVTEPERRADAIKRVAQLYETLGEPAEAQRWYRQLAEEFPSEEGFLALHLAAYSGVDQAVEMVLERLRKDLTPQNAILLAQVLLYGQLEVNSAAEESERWLSEALQRFPDDGGLLFAVSNLRLRQQRVAEATQLLERTTQVAPELLLGWNNLAALLAESTDRRAEALELIEQAFEVAGYQLPTLLDTKAVVLIHNGKAHEAVSILERITGDVQQPDPRYLFHLALGYTQLGQPERAIQAARLARDAGLLEHYLTQSERRAYDDLAQRFDPEGP